MPKLAQELNGTFKIDKNNTLAYRIRPSSSNSKQLKFTGNWSLDNKHNLTLTIDEPKNKKTRNKITFNTEIINVKADRLEFSASGKDSRGKMHFYILRLSGRWQADVYNRLNFLVAKSRGEENKLTLTGSWEINRQNELVYAYTKEYLKTKDKTSRTVTFNGYWDIRDKLRLSYVLNKELNSGFNFKVNLGKPAKRGLEYEIGIGKGLTKKTLFLFGSWKVDKNLSLTFEIPYTQGKIRSISFGATCKLNKDYTLEARLRNNLQEDLGINLKLTRKLFAGQGEAFLQMLKENKTINVLAGAGLKW